MALSKMDKLCGTCGCRLGTHYVDELSDDDGSGCCPNLSSEEPYPPQAGMYFKDSGKYRSKKCDIRNHPRMKYYG